MLKAAIKQYLRLEESYRASKLWSVRGNKKFLNGDCRLISMRLFSNLHEEFELRFQTLMLSASIFDRYLNVVLPKSARELRAVAFACSFLAMKVEEIYAPTLEEIFSPTDDCTVKDVLNQEEIIVRKLHFNFRKISPYGYLAFLQSTGSPCSKEESYMVKYLLELYLFNNYMIAELPFSLVALGIDYLLYSFRRNDASANWQNPLDVHSKESVKEVAYLLYESASKRSEPSKKYAHPRYERISRHRFFLGNLK